MSEAKASQWIRQINGLFYNETDNSLLSEQPTMAGMTDTLDTISPDDDLFFDDDPKNINQVHNAVEAYNRAVDVYIKYPVEEYLLQEGNRKKIKLKTIYCPPKRLQLIQVMPPSASKGVMVRPKVMKDVIGIWDAPQSSDDKTPVNYSVAKGENLFAKLSKDFPKVRDETNVGRGLTIEMMNKIIAHVGKITIETRCKYYFDFDRLLSQVEGLLFDMFNQKDAISHMATKTGKEIDENYLLDEYAKYLFSNYTEDEPVDGTGRLYKLKEMFASIDGRGIGIYIVTNNGSAQRTTSNNERELFIKLIRKLHPAFDGDNLICSQTNAARNKGEIIVKIKNPLNLSLYLPELFPKGGMKHTHHRKTNRRRKSSSTLKRRRKHSTHKKRKHNKNKR